jgi:hypothetical protein
MAHKTTSILYTCVIFIAIGSLTKHYNTINCVPESGLDRVNKPSNNGVAFAFSGAGGRIAQHLALMEALVKGYVCHTEVTTVTVMCRVHPELKSGQALFQALLLEHFLL